MEEMAKKSVDVAALGEILIDFTESGVSPSGQALYERNAGGAPANVAVAVARLGGISAFIGKTGTDPLGSFLRDTLRSCGVDIRGMREDGARHTTLAFVSLTSGGERAFSFCRDPGADTCLSTDELDSRLLSTAKILHVGSLSLVREPARSATLAAILAVRAAGGLISYDPNWRPSLWPSREAGVAAMKDLFAYSDIVKVSDEELSLLFGVDGAVTSAISSGADEILSLGPRLVFVTLGSRGAFWKTRAGEGLVPGFAASVIDTTGAGDSFVGGLLYRLSRAERVNLDSLGAGEVTEMVRFANAVAACCVSRRGAIPAMPKLDEVRSRLGS